MIKISTHVKKRGISTHANYLTPFKLASGLGLTSGLASGLSNILDKIFLILLESCYFMVSTIINNTKK